MIFSKNCQIGKIIRALIHLNSICDKNIEQRVILEYQFSEDRVGFELRNETLKSRQFILLGTVIFDP